MRHPGQEHPVPPDTSGPSEPASSPCCPAQPRPSLIDAPELRNHWTNRLIRVELRAWYRLAGWRSPGHASGETEGPALLALAHRPVRRGRGEPAVLAGGRAGPAGHGSAGKARGRVPGPIPRQAPAHAAASGPRLAARDRPPSGLRPICVRGATSIGRGCRYVRRSTKAARQPVDLMDDADASPTAPQAPPQLQATMITR